MGAPLKDVQPAEASAPPRAPRPRPEDFAPRAVERAVRNEALQHPLTILPGAGALGFAFWNLVIGLSPVGLAGMLGLVFLTGVSAAWQYVIRGERHSRDYVGRLLALRREYEAQEVRDLQGDCQRAHFAAGVERVAVLRAARDAFEERIAATGDETPIAALGRDAFREGVAAVRRALEIHTACAEIDVARLTRERDEWVRARSRAAGPDGAALGRQIAAHERRITQHAELGELEKELLARAGEIEAALETAALDLAARAGRAAAPSGGGADAQLAVVLEAARRVQQRALGGAQPGDEEYLADKEGTHGR